MYEIEHHTKITRATCRYTDGSRADGKKLFLLPLTVMRSDVNLSAVNHPEVAFDTDWFTRLFLTYYCKALSRVRFCKNDFHLGEIWKFENKGRLVTEYSIRFDKNRTLTHKEINVLLYFEHESLPSLAFHHFYNCKNIQFFIKNKCSYEI